MVQKLESGHSVLKRQQPSYRIDANLERDSVDVHERFAIHKEAIWNIVHLPHTQKQVTEVCAQIPKTIQIREIGYLYVVFVEVLDNPFHTTSLSHLGLIQS